MVKLILLSKEDSYIIFVSDGDNTEYDIPMLDPVLSKINAIEDKLGSDPANTGKHTALVLHKDTVCGNAINTLIKGINALILDPGASLRCEIYSHIDSVNLGTESSITIDEKSTELPEEFTINAGATLSFGNDKKYQICPIENIQFYSEDLLRMLDPEIYEIIAREFIEFKCVNIEEEEMDIIKHSLYCPNPWTTLPWLQSPKCGETRNIDHYDKYKALAKYTAPDTIFEQILYSCFERDTIQNIRDYILDNATDYKESFGILAKALGTDTAKIIIKFAEFDMGAINKILEEQGSLHVIGSDYAITNDR